MLLTEAKMAAATSELLTGWCLFGLALLVSGALSARFSSARPATAPLRPCDVSVSPFFFLSRLSLGQVFPLSPSLREHQPSKFPLKLYSHSPSWRAPLPFPRSPWLGPATCSSSPAASRPCVCLAGLLLSWGVPDKGYVVTQ